MKHLLLSLLFALAASCLLAQKDFRIYRALSGTYLDREIHLEDNIFIAIYTYEFEGTKYLMMSVIRGYKGNPLLWRDHSPDKVIHLTLNTSKMEFSPGDGETYFGQVRGKGYWAFADLLALDKMVPLETYISMMYYKDERGNFKCYFESAPATIRGEFEGWGPW